MRSFSPPERPLGWLLPVLALLAEGALLAVAYIAVEIVVDNRLPLLGTLEFAAAAGLAAIAARRRWVDPDGRPMGFLLLLAGLGLIGWLWSAEARELALAGDPVAAIARHPGGWLLVVAAMRGVGRAFEVDDRALTRLVLGGVPALAIPWALGQLTAPVELRPAFTEAAFVASLTFVTTGFIAAGLARLGEIGRETGIDWRHDRSWMGTVFGVLVVVLAIGIPASILLGLPGSAVARGILDPLLTVTGYVLIGFAAVAALAAAILASALRSIGIRLPAPMTPEEIARLGDVPEYTFDQLRGGLTGLMVLWIVLIAVLFVLLRVWIRRRKRRVTRSADEERSIQLPGRRRPTSPPAEPTGAPHPHIRVTDAVTAYLGALAELELRRPDAARHGAETPRAHATRAALGVELDALQADYALARYGNRQLTPPEHRRAVGRWARLRDRLRP